MGYGPVVGGALEVGRRRSDLQCRCGMRRYRWRLVLAGKCAYGGDDHCVGIVAFW